MSDQDAKRIDEINKALEVTSQIDDEDIPLPTGTVFEFHDVDYIEVEYLTLPITDLTMKYLIRIVKPVALVLDANPIEVRFVAGEDQIEYIKDEVLKRWRSDICEYPDTEESKEANESIKKLHAIKEVRLHEVELRRKCDKK